MQQYLQRLDDHCRFRYVLSNAYAEARIPATSSAGTVATTPFFITAPAAMYAPGMLFVVAHILLCCLITVWMLFLVHIGGPFVPALMPEVISTVGLLGLSQCFAATTALRLANLERYLNAAEAEKRCWLRVANHHINEQYPDNLPHYPSPDPPPS